MSIAATPRVSVGLALLALAIVAAPLFADAFVLRLAARIAILSLGAIAVDLVLGFAGLVSFGHAAFFGAGAYCAGILLINGIGDAAIVWPAAILTGLLLALAIGAFSLRTSGIYFIMITLAFAQMLYYGANALTEYGGADGFRLGHRNTLFGLPLDDARAFYALCVGTLALALYLSHRAMNAVFGAALRAVRDDAVRADAFGLPPFTYRLAVISASGGLAALAGAMAANLDLYIAPSSTFSWHISAEFLIFVIIGSAGTLVGPVIGATLYTVFVEILSSYTDHWMLAIGAVILVRVLLLKRGLYDVMRERLRLA
jgi:branched-chain amino acid transport system permease protein